VAELRHERDWDRLLVVDRRTGVVSLKPELVLSDVQAFVSAAVRAIEPNSKAGRTERLAAAEEALAIGLLLAAAAATDPAGLEDAWRRGPSPRPRSRACRASR
jgi:hypothetical protein